MTTPVSIPKLVKEYIDDLDEKRLREFQWHLVQIQVDGSRPILRSRLENATREETVDILVQVFGEDGAVERTVDTFFRMKLNDFASKLIQAKIDRMNQSMEQQVDEPGASSAREKSGASSAREKSGASSAREESGASSAREEPGASSAREKSGASSAREEPGASSAREEPGASSAREKSGASSAREESGASTAREEPGASSAREEPGASSAREKPREDDPTVLESFCCPICLCLFTEPVVLQCGHSFCQSCVHQHWETSTRRQCPVCRMYTFEDNPPINFNLKSLCENYRGRSQGEPSGGHRNDTELFQTPPKNIKEELEKTKQLCDSSDERIKTQSCNTENKITDDFNMLRALLDEEEKTKRDELREEARLKGCMTHLMSDMIENTSSLCDAIEEIGKFGAGERFTGDCMAVMLRMQTDLRNLQTVSQPGINMSEQVENLPRTVLTKMLNDINRTSVVLDPETASSCPSVSDHPTKVKVNDTRQPCPGNTECSTRYQEDLQKSPKRMRLEQDYENGKVSFHDPDNKASIPTNEGTLTQKMYPYISHIRVIDEDEVEHNLLVVPRVIDEDEDEAGDEVEQGRAETFREEGAQS